MMKILKKNITVDEAIKIQNKMLENYAYAVEVVEGDEGDFMVIGNKEEKECYDKKWYLWDDDKDEEF